MRVRPVLAPLLAAVVLTAALAGPSVAQTAGVHRWLGEVGVIAPAASFTELSFVQHDHLAKTVDIFGNTKFSFLASNVAAAGDHPKSYSWTVTEGQQGNGRTVAHGTFTLAAGASITVPVHFQIADCHRRNLIAVTLHGPDSREPALHYWVVEHGSALWKASGGPSCGI